MENEAIKLVPIAKVLTVNELSGWLGKSLIIPVGKQGVLVDTDGSCKVLPPGKNKILSPLARINGKGLGLRAGYIPADMFDVVARYENLLSGDDEFLDVDLILKVKVIDPQVFFVNFVCPIGELYELPNFGKESLKNKIKQVVGQYERTDVIHNIPSERLVEELFLEIKEIFPGMGLQLMEVSLLVFKCSEDRLLVEDKLAELEMKLDENREEYTDRESEDQVKLNTFANEILPKSAGLRSKGNKSFAEVVKSLQQFRQYKWMPKQHWLLKSMQTPKDLELDQKTKLALKKWRSIKLRWIALLLLIGAASTYLLYRFGINMRSESVATFLIGIWGLIISLMISTLKQMVEKQELLIFGSKNWSDFEVAHFISQNDRREADHLVRQQCSNELRNTQETLNELRGIVFQSNKTDLALRIKGLEKELEKRKEDFLSSGYGTPFYLSDIPVNESDWQRILDREEEILSLTKNLAGMAEDARMSAEEVEIKDMEKIESQLYFLEAQFKNRSRLD